MNIMNYTKKKSRTKWFIIITCLVSLIIISIIVVAFLRKKDYYYYFAKDDVYYLDKSNPTFNVSIYSTHQDDYYLDMTSINSVVLKSQDRKEFYTLNLNKIVKEQQTEIYQNQTFYKYRFNLMLPLKEIDNFSLDDATLELNYISDESLSLKLGTFIMYDNLNDSHLTITKLKGVVNTIDNLQVLCGMGITISSKNNVTIKKIETLDQRININNDQIKVLENSDYLNETLMSTLLQDEYNPYHVNTTNNLDITINDTESKHYLIPFSYQKLFSIDTLGFIITYSLDGIIYQQLIYPFKFYATTTNSYEVIKYVPNNH